MNLEHIKKAGARKSLLDEAAEIVRCLKDYENQYKFYECEQKAKELSLIYAELLAMSKEK